jgi:Fungal trichothecene efflux pump (TRI12)
LLTLSACACANTTNKNTVAALVTIGSFFTGYLDSIGLAMASICVKDQRDIGTAVGITGSIRGTVATIGTAIYTVILSNKLTQYIPALVIPAATEAGLPVSSVPQFIGALSGATDITTVPGVNANIIAAGTAAYKVATVEAYRMVFYATIAFTGVGVVLAICAPNVDDLMTDKVATTLQRTGEKEVDSEQ